MNEGDGTRFPERIQALDRKPAVCTYAATLLAAELRRAVPLGRML